jgi:hypothetical protein
MEGNEIPLDPRHGVPSGASKTISSLWYFRHKPCAYLASRLAPPPNGLKRNSSWASTPRSTIGCIQNNFWAYGMFGANRAAILHRHKHCLQTDRKEIPDDPRHLGFPSGASKMIFEPMVLLPQTVHLSSIKISTISKRTKTSFKLGLVT